MSNQPDTSDDLIAELAKLMATNAKSETSGARPAAAPGPTGAPSPAVAALAGTGARPAVRIPGLDMPPLAVVPIDGSAPRSEVRPAHFDFKPMAPPPSQVKPGTTVPPAVRIPGMDQPVATGAAASAPRSVGTGTPAGPAAGSATRPAAPPVLSPVSPSKPLVAAPDLRPVEARGQSPGSALGPAAPAGRIEPRLVPAATPPSAGGPAGAPRPASKDEPRRQAGPAGEFDFGFGTNDKAREQAKDAPAVSYDPIGEIIEADRKQADTGKPADAAKPVPPMRPVEIAASAPRPASVTPVPAQQRPAQQAPASGPAARLPSAAPLSLKPGFAARPVPAENDRFFVAPVFGMSGKPAAPAAHPAAPAPATTAGAQRRPGESIDAIEDLIGEAVRVDAAAEKAPLHQPEPVRPEARPVVPPLTTSFTPRRAGLREGGEAAPETAEAAILAAAAVSGTDVGRIEPVLGEEPGPQRRKTRYRPKPARPPGGARQYVGLAVAGTLLLAAGFGLYWVLNMGRADPSAAPLLTADSSPLKEVPAVVASTEPSSPVLDQIDGVAAAPGQETLVSRDDTEGEAVTDVAAAPEVTESGLANRKVRTVTVRPDGTIVAADDALAGSQALPVDRPDVPDVPGEPISPSDLLTAAASTAVDAVTPDPIAAVIANADAPAPTADAASTPQTTAVESIDVASAGQPAAAATGQPAPVTALALVPEGAVATPADVVAPVPMARPLDREALGGQPGQSVTAAVDPDNGGLALTAGGQQIDLLAPQPEPEQVAVATTPDAGDAAAYVQLSAQRDEATARADARSFTSRFSGLFGGSEIEIHRVDLGAKGTWYRVLVPADSRASANSVCLDIKNAGGDCLIR